METKDESIQSVLKFIEPSGNKNREISESDIKKLKEEPDNFFNSAEFEYLYEINFPIDSHFEMVNAKYFKKCYSISFPPSLKTIPFLNGCRSLEEITFPSNPEFPNHLENIEDKAFSDTKIQSIVIPESVSVIGSYCFPKSLKEIDFEKGAPNLEEVKKFAFSRLELDTFKLPFNTNPFKEGRNIFLMSKNLKTVIFDHYADKNNSDQIVYKDIDEDIILKKKEFNCKTKHCINGFHYNEIHNACFNSFNKNAGSLLEDEEGYCYYLPNWYSDDDIADTCPNQDIANSFLLSQTKIENLEVFCSDLSPFSFYNTPKLVNIKVPNIEHSKFEKNKGILYQKSMLRLIVAERNIKEALISSKCIIINAFAFNFKSFEKVEFEKNSKLQEIHQFAFSDTKIKAIDFPDTVDYLGIGTFYNCKELKSVKLPSSITILSEATFSHSMLTEITIPKSVISIHSHCFYRCSNLRKVTFQKDSKLCSIESYAFAFTKIESISIPESVVSLGNYCFLECSKLKSINTESLKIIGIQCFRGTLIEEFQLSKIKICDFSFSNAKIVSIPSSAPLIEISGFIGSPITQLTIPSSVPAIYDYTFLECTKLTSIKILDINKSKLKYIGHRAFKDCTSLTEFELPEHISFFGEECFYNCSKCNIKIKASNDKNIIVKKFAFKNSNVVSFESKSRNIYIDKYAFENCKNLTEFAADVSNTCEIDYKAFKNCTSLNSVEISQEAKEVKLGECSFFNSGIKKIEIPNKLEFVPNSCFKFCKSLETVKISGDSEITEFQDNAFFGAGVKLIYIPSNTKLIGTSCFEECKQLKQLRFSSKINNCVISERAFYASGIIELHIPEGINMFDFECFSKCSNLRKLTFSDEIKFDNIAENAFESTGIKEVSFPPKINTVGKNSFRNCQNLQKISFHANEYVQIKPFAFSECKNLLEVCVHSKLMVYPIITCYDDILSEIYFLLTQEQINKHIIDCLLINSMQIITPYHHLKFDSFLSIKDIFHFNNEIKNSYRFRYVFFKNNVFYLDSGKKLLSCSFAAQSINISKETEIIKSCALKYSNITKVDFESGSQLQIIKRSAFENTQIEEITIPDSVKIIGESAFCDCKSLKKVNISEKSQLQTIESCAFENTRIETIIFPAKLQEIGEYAFYKCNMLKTVDNHSNKITFGFSSFALSSIEKIDFPQNSVFECSSFKKCINLKHLTFLDKPKNISFGEESFAFTGLEDINLKCNVDIKENAFIFCKSMCQIMLGGPNILCHSKAFKYSNINSCILTIKQSNREEEFDIFKLLTTNIEKCSLTLNKPDSKIEYFLNHNCYVVDDTMIYADLINNPLLFEKVSEKKLKSETIKKNEILRISSKAKILDFPVMSHVMNINWGQNCIVESFVQGLFSYYSLTKITIPKLVKVIPAFLFEHCHYLKVVDFEEGSKLTEIGEYSFAFTRIEQVKLPESVQFIREYAFFSIKELKEVEFHGKIIEKEAFARTGLVRFTLPNSTVSIGANAFQYCHSLTEFNIDIINSKLSEIEEFAFSETGIQSINIPPLISKIKAYTFDGCERLKEVNISDDSQIIEIDNHSFSGSVSLERINFPEKLSKLFSKDFITCPFKLSITTDEFKCFALIKEKLPDQNDSTKSIEKYALKLTPFDFLHRESPDKMLFIINRCHVINNVLIYAEMIDNSILYQKLKEEIKDDQPKKTEVLKVPNKVKKLDFPVMSHIKKIIWGNQSMVKKLGPPGHFAYYNLTEITIPKLVKKIPPRLFQHCHYLKVVDFEADSRLVLIDEFSFSHTRIEKIKLPESVKIIKKSAFYDIKELKEVEFSGIIIEDEAFSQTGLEKFTLSNNTKIIGSSAFQYCHCLAEFNIDTENSQLAKIGPYAFSESSIQNINIPPSIKIIKKGVFDGCQRLKEVCISDQSLLSKIDHYSFTGCLSLEKINLPQSIKRISYTAFINTPSLSSIMSQSNEHFNIMDDKSVYHTNKSLVFVPRNITKYKVDQYCKIIHSGAFCGPHLEEVSFADESLRYIEQGAFAHSAKLKKISVPKLIKYLGDEAFIHCSSLESIDFDQNCPLKKFPRFCFAFSGLISISLPLVTQVIDNSCFFFCQNLKNIKLHKTHVKYIGSYAFAHTSIERVLLPSSVKLIGSHIFDGNKSMKLVDFSKIEKITEIRKEPKIFKKFIYMLTLHKPNKNKDNIQDHEKPQFNVHEPPKKNKPDSSYPAVILLKGNKSKPVPKIFKPILNKNQSRSTSIKSLSRPASVIRSSYANNIFRPPSNNENNNVEANNSSNENNNNIKVDDSSNKNKNSEENMNAKQEKAKIKSLISNSDCFVHKFALCGSSVKTIKFNLQEYRWYHFLSQCANINEFFVNDNIQFGFRKASGIKLFGNKYSVSQIGWNDANIIPLFSKRQSIQNKQIFLTPFHFVDSSNLKTVHLGNATFLKSIPNHTFAYTDLKEIEVPSSLKTIGQYSFLCCTKLEKVTIPTDSKLSKIRIGAFMGCENLSSIFIPSNVKMISNKCFASTGLNSIELPKSIKKIGAMAFNNCHKLNKVILNNEIVEIGDSSFRNCISLTTIDLPDSLKTIKSHAFSYCIKLEKVNTTENTELVEIYNGAFECTQINELGVSQLAKTLFEPKLVPNLNKITFYKGSPRNFIQMKDGTIYEKQEHIIKFDDNSKERDIYKFYCEFHDKTIESKEELFYENVTDLYNRNRSEYSDDLLSHPVLNLVFAPKNLECLQIHNDCFSINSSVLADMKNLTTIEYIKGPTNAILNFPDYNHLFTGIDNKLRHIKIIGSYSSMERGVFAYFNSLEVVEFGESTNLARVSEFAFHGCKNLKKITLPSSCCIIEKGAFKDCTNLKSVGFSKKGEMQLRYIQQQAFFNCSSIESFCVPSTIHCISSKAFMNCTKLAKFEFVKQKDKNQEDSLLIGKNAFKNCTSLQSIILPNKEINLQICVFMNCTSLHTFKYKGNSIYSIPYRAFFNCSSLKEFSISTNMEYDLLNKSYYGHTYGNNLTLFSIGSESFMNCTSLTDASFEDNSKDIETIEVTKEGNPKQTNFFYKTCLFHRVWDNAFRNCKNLRRVRLFLGNLHELHSGSFAECSSLKTIETNTKFWRYMSEFCAESKALEGTPADLVIELFSKSKHVHTLAKPLSEINHPRRRRFIKQEPPEIDKIIKWIPQDAETSKKQKLRSFNWPSYFHSPFDVFSFTPGPGEYDLPPLHSGPMFTLKSRIEYGPNWDTCLMKAEPWKTTRQLRRRNYSHLNRNLLAWPIPGEVEVPDEKDEESEIDEKIKFDPVVFKKPTVLNRSSIPSTGPMFTFGSRCEKLILDVVNCRNGMMVKKGKIENFSCFFFTVKKPVFEKPQDIYRKNLSKLNKSFLTWDEDANEKTKAEKVDSKVNRK